MFLLFTVGLADAHIAMTFPATRYADQKRGPCGRGAGDAPSGNVTVFAPGETITLAWTETINHPSHYRISFDIDGQDAFEDPPQMKAFYSNDAVLLDNISDAGGPGFQAQITLPNVQCESCTLQLVQVMYDKPPYVPGTNDLYYQCADIALRGELQPTDTGSVVPTGTDTGTPPIPDTGTAATNTFPPPLTNVPPEIEDKGGCACAAGARPGGAWLALLPLTIFLRRRSR